jgi:hypothetical protein
MVAVIGLVGVVLGALLAPVLDWVRQSRRAKAERRRELLEAVAEFVSASGDVLTAEWDAGGMKDAWRSGVGFRANAARWRLALLAPVPVAEAAHAFADATDEIGRRIQAAGGWDPAAIGAEYDAWKAAERQLIEEARKQLATDRVRR